MLPLASLPPGCCAPSGGAVPLAELLLAVALLLAALLLLAELLRADVHIPAAPPPWRGCTWRWGCSQRRR